jgi:hypothetical protein
MKKKNMAVKIVFVLCLVVFTILLILPPKVDAKVTHMPGAKGPGPYGDTCICPEWPYYDCGCAIVSDE